MNSRDLDKHHVVHEYATTDDAIRAIQALKLAGISDKDIHIIAHDTVAAQRVSDATDVRAEEVPGVDERSASEFGQHLADGYVAVVVTTDEHATLAERLMRDGLVDGAGIYAPHDDTVVDSSVGSGAAVATSSGTATGMTPGGGYEPNTGSSVASSAGTLGQFAPGADTPNEEDDFPG